MSGFSLLHKIRNKIKVTPLNSVEIEADTRIRHCDIYIAGKNNRLIIQEGVNLKGVCIELHGEDCTLIIGKHCIIGQHCYLSCREKATSLIIGEHCMFSRNVKLMTSDGHDITKNGIRVNHAKNITIGNHVWLADNVTVLKGVSIGHGSLVGINSTVTKNVGEQSVAAGNPAKVIVTDIEWHDELNY